MYFLVSYKDTDCTYVVRNAKFSNDYIEGKFQCSTCPESGWIGAGAWHFNSLKRLEMVKDLPEWAQEYTTYYKVVSYNLFSSITSGKDRVHYLPNLWTKAPKDTRLFVFETIEEANAYIEELWPRRYYPGERLIYTCHAKNPIKQRGAASQDNYDSFWKIFNKNGKVTDSDMRLANYDAILATEVKLIERVG
jgi:hypothetical protein